LIEQGEWGRMSINDGDMRSILTTAFDEDFKLFIIQHAESISIGGYTAIVKLMSMDFVKKVINLRVATMSFLDKQTLIHNSSNQFEVASMFY
jgi:ammonia channel protein AmtB